jgi:aerobic-type carbon monoxide dehydrogenase small subunit (CoxS/CutS family)
MMVYLRSLKSNFLLSIFYLEISETKNKNNFSSLTEKINITHEKKGKGKGKGKSTKIIIDNRKLDTCADKISKEKRKIINYRQFFSTTDFRYKIIISIFFKTIKINS